MAVFSDAKVLADIAEWDIYTWGRVAIQYWDNVIEEYFPSNKNLRVLDIGARNGGTSLYFGLKGMSCICSDIEEPTEKAKALHCKYGVSSLIYYDIVDCTNIKFEDGTFDIVAFKSVMGAVGRNSNYNSICKAAAEIYRVLKPNGLLVFCENLQGSWLHKISRKTLVKWGNSWNYLTIDFINQIIRGFSEYQIKTYGFLNCFIKSNSLVNWLDNKLCRIIKPQNQYMCYGYARK